MPNNTQRFILRRTAATVWQIVDLKEALPVCIITRNGRSPDRLQAMVTVMLNALNAAASRPELTVTSDGQAS